MSRSLETVSSEDRAIAGSSRDSESQQQNPYIITEAMLKRKLERKNRGRCITQFICALAASLAALSFGTVIGWSSAVPGFFMGRLTPFNLTEQEFGWLASLTPLGCSAGIMPWTYGIKHLGPKHIMILQTPFYLLTLLIMVTIKTYASYLVTRFLSGFLSISYLMGAERLLTGSVHASRLPVMTTFFRVSVMLGIFLSYVIGDFTSSKLYLTLMSASIPSINTLLLFILPESPVFLYDRSEQKAEKALSWYRGRTNKYMALQSLRKDAEIRKIGGEGNMYMLYSKVVMKAFLITVGLNFFRVFSGYYAFVFYNSLIWDEYTNVFGTVTDTIVFGMSLCVSNFVGSQVYYNTKHGIRKLLLISCSIISVALTILTICTFFFRQKYLPSILKYCNWIPVTSINMYLIGYELGLGIYPDIILYEYLPYQVHNTARSCSGVLYWFQVFLLIKYFLTIEMVSFSFVSFAIMTVISYSSIIYCYYLVIETKGKNLMQIQIEIGGNPIGNRGAYRYRMGHGDRHGLYIS